MIIRKSIKDLRSLSIEKLEERSLFALDVVDLAMNDLLNETPRVPSVVVATPPPTVAALYFSGSSSTQGVSVTSSVAGTDISGTASLKYSWLMKSGPTGGKVTFAVNANATAKDNTLTFNRCGNYTIQVTVQGKGLVTKVLTKEFTVVPTLTSIEFTDVSGKIANATTPIVVTSTLQKFLYRGLDQFGKPTSTVPSLTWSATSKPADGNYKVLAAGSELTACFNKLGDYVLSASVGTLPSKEVKFSVIPTMNFISASQPNGSYLRTQSPLEINSSQLRATAFAIDQFGGILEKQPKITWTAKAATSGASVKLLAELNSATFEFSKSGAYTLKAASGGLSITFTANVTTPTPVFTYIKTSQQSVSLQLGQSQVLTVQALDQYEKPLATQPTFKWSSTGGIVTTGAKSSTATFVAGQQSGSYLVTVGSGTLSRVITIQIVAPKPNADGIQTPALANLINDLYRDSQLSRNDVISILRSTALDNIVDTSEYVDLRYLFVTSTNYVMPNYVRTLAKNAIDTNPANKMIQGQAAGDLAPGSSASLMNRLIDKWFLGADVPAPTNPSFVYTTATGMLFNGRPSHLDAMQGSLGDCYFIAALGALADSNPDSVRNMFIDNGDGTFTVRFYSSMGSGTTVGTDDYVTVNRRLPTDSRGNLMYANGGAAATNSSLSLWMALAEKAYAQWNETGKEGRDGTNRYSAISGGNPYYVDAQVLGYEANNYGFIDSNKQLLIDALNAKKAIVLGTNVRVSTNGLVGAHGYMMTGYDASRGTFTLYNPWGYAHPAPLTWNQLKTDGGGFTVADTSFSVANNLLRTSSVYFSLATSNPSQAILLPMGLPSVRPTEEYVQTHQEHFTPEGTDIQLAASTYDDGSILVFTSISNSEPSTNSKRSISFGTIRQAIDIEQSQLFRSVDCDFHANVAWVSSSL